MSIPSKIASAALAEGVPVISCADNPYNLRPAVDSILAAIEEKRKAGPVLVLLGETHDIPSHKAVRQMVLARLLSHKSLPQTTQGSLARFVYGTEIPHDYAEYMIEKYFELTIAADKRGLLSADDKTGDLLLLAYRTASLPGQAPITNHNLMRFCHENGIIVHANDLARVYRADIDDHVFDSRNPETRSFLENYPNLPVWELGSMSRGGNALRNEFMVSRIRFHLRHSETDVYIQQCGRVHMFGHDARGYKFDYSLAAIFEHDNILPVYLSCSDDEPASLAAEAYSVLRRGLVIDGLTEECFVAKGDPAAELSFLEKLKTNSGGEFLYAPISRPSAEQFKSEITARVAKLGFSPADIQLPKY